jgi:hypothetical protein
MKDGRKSNAPLRRQQHSNPAPAQCPVVTILNQPILETLTQTVDGNSLSLEVTVSFYWGSSLFLCLLAPQAAIFHYVRVCACMYTSSAPDPY